MSVTDKELQDLTIAELSPRIRNREVSPFFTRTVQDCALTLQPIAGFDPKDPLSSREPVPDYSKAIGKDVKGLKLGIIAGYFDDLMVGEGKGLFLQAVELLGSLGVEREELSIPHMEWIPAVHSCTSGVETVASHVPYLKTRPRDYSPDIFYRQVALLTVPAAAYVTAQRVRRIICQEFEEALKRVDVILAPAVPIPAPTFEEIQQGFIEVDGNKIPVARWSGNFWTQGSIPFNITGLPSLSLCCGFSSSGMPIGMQIVGGPFQEERVFQVAHAYERANPWYKRRPNIE